jgi:glycosyltransferase involved in cell wall biosynthesis
VRCWNIAKQFRLLGWKVDILMPDPHFWPRLENPASVAQRCKELGISRRLTGLRCRFLLPDVVGSKSSALWQVSARICQRIARFVRIDPFFGWIDSALQSCDDLRVGDIDVILASGSPFTSFIIAKKLSVRLQCPYVLDYRDAWHGNPHGELSDRPSSAAEERHLLNGSAAVTTVSTSLARMIGERFGCLDKIRVITNGYDPNELAGIIPHSFGHFAVIYAGTLYPPKRVLDPFFEAFHDFLHSGVPVARTARFHYFGPNHEEVRRCAVLHGIFHRVDTHQPMSREHALSAQAGADVNLVITSIQPEGTVAENGIITSKVFDCLGLGRPVLAVAPRGSDLRAILSNYGSAACLTGAERNAMASFLTGVATGHVSVSTGPVQFSWPRIACLLEAVLVQAINRSMRSV